MPFRFLRLRNGCRRRSRASRFPRSPFRSRLLSRERSFEGQTIMALLSQERFDQAETYAQVRERINAGGGRQAYALEYGEWAAQNVDADYTAFTALDQPLNVLVLSEDWCPDCTDGLPILNQIAEQTGKLNVRILPRDANRDLADQFLWKGQHNKIPTFIFLDAELNEI